MSAREGETLEEIGLRSGNEWDLHRTASVNGVLVGTQLAEGRLVKVAVREAWRPPTPDAAATPEADFLP